MGVEKEDMFTKKYNGSQRKDKEDAQTNIASFDKRSYKFAMRIIDCELYTTERFRDAFECIETVSKKRFSFFLGFG